MPKYFADSINTFHYLSNCDSSLECLLFRTRLDATRGRRIQGRLFGTRVVTSCDVSDLTDSVRACRDTCVVHSRIFRCPVF